MRWRGTDGGAVLKKGRTADTDLQSFCLRLDAASSETTRAQAFLLEVAREGRMRCHDSDFAVI